MHEGDLAASRGRLVFPLDVSDLAAARRWIERLALEVGVFKVGLELFTAAGPAAVEAIHDAGARCFLDLKLHDIPATMAGATRAARRLGVEYLTVHCAAGPKALDAIREEAGDALELLGVTVLTSMEDEELDAIGLAGPTADAVRRLAHMALQHGISGLVCSAHECATLRRELGDDPTLVVPGIRPEGSSLDDQRRAATPASAIAAGADLLVVGRPIRHASDPVAAARAVVAEIAATQV